MSVLFECRLIRSDGDCGKLKGTCLSKGCLKFTVDVEMLARVARCLMFLDARDVYVYVKCPNCSMLATKPH